MSSEDSAPDVFGHFRQAPDVFHWMWLISTVTTSLVLLIGINHSIKLLKVALKVRSEKKQVFLPILAGVYLKIFLFFPLIAILTWSSLFAIRFALLFQLLLHLYEVGCLLWFWDLMADFLDGPEIAYKVLHLATSLTPNAVNRLACAASQFPPSQHSEFTASTVSIPSTYKTIKTGEVSSQHTQCNDAPDIILDSTCSCKKVFLSPVSGLRCLTCKGSNSQKFQNKWNYAIRQIVSGVSRTYMKHITGTATQSILIENCRETLHDEKFKNVPLDLDENLTNQYMLTEKEDNEYGTYCESYDSNDIEQHRSFISTPTHLVNATPLPLHRQHRLNIPNQSISIAISTCLSSPLPLHGAHDLSYELSGFSSSTNEAQPRGRFDEFELAVTSAGISHASNHTLSSPRYELKEINKDRFRSSCTNIHDTQLYHLTPKLQKKPKSASFHSSFKKNCRIKKGRTYHICRRFRRCVNERRNKSIMVQTIHCPGTPLTSNQETKETLAWGRYLRTVTLGPYRILAVFPFCWLPFLVNKRCFRQADLRLSYYLVAQYLIFAVLAALGRAISQGLVLFFQVLSVTSLYVAMFGLLVLFRATSRIVPREECQLEWKFASLKIAVFLIKGTELLLRYSPIVKEYGIPYGKSTMSHAWTSFVVNVSLLPIVFVSARAYSTNDISRRYSLFHEARSGMLISLLSSFSPIHSTVCQNNAQTLEIDEVMLRIRASTPLSNKGIKNVVGEIRNPWENTFLS